SSTVLKNRTRGSFAKLRSFAKLYLWLRCPCSDVAACRQNLQALRKPAVQRLRIYPFVPHRARNDSAGTSSPEHGIERPRLRPVTYRQGRMVVEKQCRPGFKRTRVSTPTRPGRPTWHFLRME